MLKPLVSRVEQSMTILEKVDDKIYAIGKKRIYFMWLSFVMQF